MRNAAAAFVVGDRTRPATLETMVELGKQFLEVQPGSYCAFLLNKCDVPGTPNELPSPVLQSGIPSIPTSAKTGTTFAMPSSRQSTPLNGATFDDPAARDRAEAGRLLASRGVFGLVWIGDDLGRAEPLRQRRRLHVNFGIDQPRPDHRDANAFARDLMAKPDGEGMDRALGGRVVDVLLGHRAVGAGRHIDDAPPMPPCASTSA